MFSFFRMDVSEDYVAKAWKRRPNKIFMRKPNFNPIFEDRFKELSKGVKKANGNLLYELFAADCR